MKFFAGLLFASSHLVWAQGDAAQLIKEVSQTYKSLQAYHFESESKQEMGSATNGSWNRNKVVLAVAGQNRLRLETAHIPWSYEIVSDGENLWLANRGVREYVRIPRGSGNLQDIKEGGPVARQALRFLRVEMEQFWRLPDLLKDPRILREETVDFEGSKVACVVVEARTEPSVGGPPIGTSTRTFWIDKNRKLVLRHDSYVKGKLFPTMPYLAIESRSQVTFTRIELGEPAANLFTFSTPPEFTWVDSLEFNPAIAAAREMIGKPAPELKGPLLTNGSAISISELRGK